MKTRLTASKLVRVGSSAGRVSLLMQLIGEGIAKMIYRAFSLDDNEKPVCIASVKCYTLEEAEDFFTAPYQDRPSHVIGFVSAEYEGFLYRRGIVIVDRDDNTLSYVGPDNKLVRMDA
jgi:hypothetical protein